MRREAGTNIPISPDVTLAGGDEDRWIAIGVAMRQVILDFDTVFRAALLAKELRTIPATEVGASESRVNQYQFRNDAGRAA